MSVNREQINISNFNDLEEGEISDSYINKQDILKLIEEKKNKNKFPHPDNQTFNFSDDQKFEYDEMEKESDHQSEHDNFKYSSVGDGIEHPVIKLDEDEEEPQGFFHKMLKHENKIKEKFLEKKRGFANSLGLKRVKKDFNYKTKPENKRDKSDKNLSQQNNQVKQKISKDNIKQEKYQLIQNKNKKLLNKQQIKQPKQICQFYLNRACLKGMECTFSHDVAPIKKKSELCKYFLTGNCFKGNDCVFSHNTKDFPCKFFHAVGYCDKGETCK